MRLGDWGLAVLCSVMGDEVDCHLRWGVCGRERVRLPVHTHVLFAIPNCVFLSQSSTTPHPCLGRPHRLRPSHLRGRQARQHLRGDGAHALHVLRLIAFALFS